MRRRSGSTNLPMTAGLRLRCFLEIVLAGVVLIGSSFSMAQVDCVEPHQIAVSHVQGQVFDPFGIPVPRATVILVPKKGNALETKADGAGRFEVNAPSGHYAMKVEQQGFAFSKVELKIRRGFWKVLPREKLLVLLGFAGSYCPEVITSKEEFLSATQANIERLRGTVHTDATQK